jgi:hypothetical protein
MVKVHIGRHVVFGFVTLLRMRSGEDGASAQPSDANQTALEIELFAEGVWNPIHKRLKFTRGISTYPLPRQGVYLLTREEATILYQTAEGQRPGGADPLVTFATYVGADSGRCRANIDKMFGLHCAVLGSTGSGKSGAVSALLHAVLDHKPTAEQTSKPRIIIIDPHAEYGQAFKKRSIIFRGYDPIGTEQTAGMAIRLPYWLMSAEEFRFLTIGATETDATTQNNIVFKALTHARMFEAGLVNKAPSDYTGLWPNDGNPPDHPRPAKGVDPARLAEFDRDKPRPFSLAEFVNHITYVQAIRPKGAGVERVIDIEFYSAFKPILDKLAVLRRDPRIKFLMEEWTSQGATLDVILSQFVGSPSADLPQDRDIRIIDISGLPNEVAGPLAAMIARILFQYKLYQTQAERKLDPILLVCEEAHRYVPDRGDAEYASAQSAIRRIAREGRKYGLGLMLVSQRPADVESTVLSQCATWVVLRLTNSTDQQHVSRFFPDGLSGMTRVLPALAQQEALFVGEGAAIPARIRINDLPPDRRPGSENIGFAEGWSYDRPSLVDLKKVTTRMDGSG